MKYFLYPSRKLYEFQEYIGRNADGAKTTGKLGLYTFLYLAFLAIVYLLPIKLYVHFTDNFGFFNWKELAFIFIWWGYLLAGKPKGERPF